MSLIAVLVVALLAWLVFKSLVAVLITLLIAAVVVWIINNAPRGTRP